MQSMDAGFAEADTGIVTGLPRPLHRKFYPGGGGGGGGGLSPGKKVLLHDKSASL